MDNVVKKGNYKGHGKGLELVGGKSEMFEINQDYFASRKTKVPFSMAIGHGELMHECFPKHLRIGTARTK